MTTLTNVLPSAHAGQPTIAIKAPVQILPVPGQWVDGKFLPEPPFRGIYDASTGKFLPDDHAL
jgi:hypothetical protein